MSLNLNPISYMKRFFLLFSFVLTGLTVFGQQNAPVAGQASALYDLLKKDYSSIDPDLVGDQLVADRAQVISTFRSFANPSNPSKYKFSFTAAQLDTITTAKAMASSYNTAKKLAAIPGITSISGNGANATSTNTANQQSTIDMQTKQQAFYHTRFRADTLLLHQLAFNYYDEGNYFVTNVINMFIAKYTATDAGTADPYSVVNANGSVNKALPIVGEFGNTAQIITTLGNITAQRLKAELMTFAAQIIQKWLNDHRYTTPTEELVTLFPKTFAYIMAFDADQIANFPNTIRQQITADLNNLMVNGYLLKNTTLFNQLITQYPDIELAFEAFHLIPQLTKLKNPSDFISVVASSQLVADLKTRTLSDGSADPVRQNIAAAFTFLDLMSNSLTMTNNGDPQYTTIDFWTHYGRELSFMKLYLGFLRQQNVKYYNVTYIINKKPITLDSNLTSLIKKADTEILPKVMLLQPIVTDICKNSQDVYEQAQNLKKLNNAGQKVSADTIFSFNKSIINFARDLTTDADKVVAIIAPDFKDATSIAQKTQKFIMLADSVNDGVKNIYDKNYAAGVISLIQTVLALMPANQPQQAYVQLFSLSKIKSPTFAKWASVTALISGGGSANSSQKAAAIQISTELSSVELYYKKSTKPSNKIIKELSTAQNLLSKLATSDTISQAALSKIWQDNDFKAIVVSYYANAYIADQANQLAGQMKANSSADNITFLNNMQLYTSLTFTTIVTGQTSDPQILKSAEDGIDSMIMHYTKTQSTPLGYQLDPRVVSLINFINDMATAKDSAGVESAIEKLVLPAGSYSVKQKSAYSLTINAFPGIIGGWELTSTKHTAGSLGFTAPIGINMTWGKVYKNSTLGVFIPLIDVGAVTRYRFDKDTTTSQLPQLTWKNIFSPGLYLTIGIGGTPFSVNLGAQYGPEVKDLKVGTELSSWRIGAGLTVDIPFFNIYNKPLSN